MLSAPHLQLDFYGWLDSAFRQLLGNPHMVALPSGGWRIYCDAMDATGTLGIVSAWSF